MEEKNEKEQLSCCTVFNQLWHLAKCVCVCELHVNILPLLFLFAFF